MVQAGKTFYREGAAAAQAQLDSTLSERRWQIDRELSSTEGLVLKKGEQVRVAYRGTDFTNINDLVTDASVVAGMEEKVAPQMRESRMQIEDIYTKYGKLPTELLGYSKGGAHAMAMGDHFRIPSTSYNPLVGRKQLTTKSEVPHTIIRTVEDPVSSALALAKGKKNYTVKAIDPIFGLGGPKNAHELTHFTSAGKRQPGGIEQLMHEAVRKGQTLSHFETMDHFATAREQGLSFTEALDSFKEAEEARQAAAQRISSALVGVTLLLMIQILRPAVALQERAEKEAEEAKQAAVTSLSMIRTQRPQGSTARPVAAAVVVALDSKWRPTLRSVAWRFVP